MVLSKLVHRILNVLSGFVILLIVGPHMCAERIEPGMIGVRRSLEGGVTEEDFSTGYHVSIPFYHSWYALDGTFFYLEYDETKNQALDVRTKENNIIFIDLAIPYRIKPGQGWRIVREGFLDSYEDKVKSTATGILRENLAEFSNLDVQQPEVRRAVASKTLPILNQALDQYHVEATHVIIRGIRFRDQYEVKLQNKQLFVVQGRLDEARQRELAAKQETDTLEKSIVRDISLKVEEWNQKIEESKAQFEVDIAGINADAVKYTRQRRAEADALYSKLQAEGDLAEAQAEALGQKLKSAALATPAGLTYSAIEAVRNFEIGDFLLNSADAGFLEKFAGMAAWRRFFLGQ